MSKKATLELSINAIVIIVIAITFLGLALVFVKNIFSSATDITKTLLSKEPEPATPTKDNPITSSRETITTRPGETVVIRFKILNPSDTDWVFKPDVDPTKVECGKSNDDACYIDSSNDLCKSLSQDTDCNPIGKSNCNTASYDGVCYINPIDCQYPDDMDCAPTPGVTLEITGCTFDVQSEINQIKIGEIVPYTGVMIIPKTQPKGTLVCRISIGGTGANIGKDIVFNVE